MPDIGRDRSGRIPRASRAQTFYQAINPPGPVRPEVEQTLAEGEPLPPVHNDNPTTDDITRGNGY